MPIFRAPTLGKEIPGHFQDFLGPQRFFTGPCKPAMFKYRDKQQLWIAASILEYTFITVTCCEEMANKLFEHFLQLFTILASASTSLCLPHASLPSKFQDLPGPCT